MADHDQLFKRLLQEFFAEFIHLFFADWAGRFDFGGVEFLQTELFTDVPRGERRSVDLVAQLPVTKEVAAARPGEEPSWIALVHVEVESADRVAPLRPRMFDYYWMLRHRYRLPVLPIGLYLRVGLEGVGWDEYEEWFWERRLVYFDYAYVGLPALDAERYVQGENIFGVALSALMRIPAERRAWLRLEGLRRVVASNEKAARQLLLANCIQAYLPLEEQQWVEFQRLLITQEFAEVRAMATTWFDEGIEMGELKKGRAWLQFAVEKRFGPLPAPIIATIQSMPNDRLDEVMHRLFDAQSLEELDLGNGSPTN